MLFLFDKVVFPVFQHFFSLCTHKLRGWYGFSGKDPEESLDALCKRHDVPEEFAAILPGGHHRVCLPCPQGSVCVYADALEASMRVPLHAFFCEVLTYFGFALSQIAPNGWRVMAGFVVLSRFAGVLPFAPRVPALLLAVRAQAEGMVRVLGQGSRSRSTPYARGTTSLFE
jgi:hypothetical protein